MRRVLMLAVMLFAVEVFAGAPFCMVSAAGPQCFYYSRADCESAAKMSDGACVANSESSRERPHTGAPFCMVSAAGKQCFYYSRAACEQAAAMSDGACVAN